jgi:hypothetical protein
MFLTDRQIIRLTGLREKSAQVKWLVDHQIRHWVNAAEKPVVPCSAIDAPWKPEPSAATWSPDFSKLAQ